jgi:hypothetical protein
MRYDFELKLLKILRGSISNGNNYHFLKLHIYSSQRNRILNPHSVTGMKNITSLPIEKRLKTNLFSKNNVLQGINNPSFNDFKR